MKRETVIDRRCGLYLDNRSNSYLWRGRFMGKPKTVRIRHEATGVVATTANMTKAEAVRIAKQIDADAANGKLTKPTPTVIETVETGITVAEAWKLYWDRDASELSSSREKQRCWDRYLSQWKDRPLASITKRDCAALVEQCRAEAGGLGYAPNTLQKNARRFFGWCADEGYGATGLEASPMAGIKRKPVNTERTKRPSRALNEQEIIWWFKALDRIGGREADAIEFVMRSMCRVSENFNALWSWDKGTDLDIPVTKAVGRNAAAYPLLLPLTPSMRALIGERGDKPLDAPLWGVRKDWISHASLKARQMMTEIAASEGSNANFHDERIGGERNPSYFSLHDFRDSGKAYLKSVRTDEGLPKFSSEVREACLNHRETGIAKVYGSDIGDADYLYLPRKVAGAAWNAYLDGLKAKALADVALAA